MGPLAQGQFSRTGVAAGEIGPGPDTVIEAEIALVLQLMRHGCAERRVADMLGQGAEVAGQDQIKIGLGQGFLNPVDDGFQGRNFG